MRFKSLFTAIAAIAFTVMGANAQNNINTFNNGDVAINLGFGLGGYHQYDVDAFTPSFNASAEYGFLEGIIKGKGCISGGLVLGYGWGHDKDYSEIDVNRFRFGTRGALHYQFIPQLDMYGGLALCFDNEKAKIDYKEDGEHYSYEKKKTTFNPFIFAGIRYMMSSNFGFYSELTWDDFAAFQLGVSFKL